MTLNHHNNGYSTKQIEQNNSLRLRGRCCERRNGSSETQTAFAYKKRSKVLFITLALIDKRYRSFLNFLNRVGEAIGVFFVTDVTIEYHRNVAK